jgi:hypothetical protein
MLNVIATYEVDCFEKLQKLTNYEHCQLSKDDVQTLHGFANGCNPVGAPYWLSFGKMKLMALRNTNHSHRSRSDYVEKIAMKKVLNLADFQHIDGAGTFDSYLHNFYIYDSQREHILETPNQYYSRVFSKFRSVLIYFVGLYVAYDQTCIMNIDGNNVVCRVPNDDNVSKVHSLALNFLRDLQGLGLDKVVVLPPNNAIDDAIDAERDAEASWRDYDMFDEYGADEEKRMDDETDGFWRIENDID